MAIVVIALSATLWGQRPKPPIGPKTLLVPAEPVWSITLDSTPSAPGIMDASRIYLPLVPDRLLALSRDTGIAEWTREIEAVASPLRVGDALFILASDEIHALDAATGTERWRVPFDHPAKVSLVAVGPRVIGISDATTVVSLSIADGSRIWQQDVGAAVTHLAAGGDRLFATLADKRLLALMAEDGKVAWSAALDGTLTSPAVMGARVVVGSDANEFAALDAAKGSLAWRWRVGADAVGAGGDARLVFLAGLDNVLRAVALGNGNQRWKKAIPNRTAHPPQLFGDLVVVTGTSPTVSVYSAETGAAIGNYVAPGEIEGPALLAGARTPSDVVMVVVTRDGRVIGLRPKPPEPPVPAGRGGPATLTPPGVSPAGGVTPAPPPRP